MLSAIFITLFFLAGLGSAQRTSRSDELILHHPYNDRHNDAAGARDDHVG